MYINVNDNQLVMFAMFLDFTVVISLLISFEIGVCTLMKVIIALVNSWEIASMDKPIKIIKGKAWARRWG
jgi:hypothetical protein